MRDEVSSVGRARFDERRRGAEALILYQNVRANIRTGEKIRRFLREYGLVPIKEKGLK